VSIHRSIAAFQRSAEGEHHRYRSWGHCYSYFRQARRNGLAADRDHAALQLAFYLASWGMYRGSGFLLQHTYTVHRGVIDVIAEARFDDLWDADFGATDTDSQLMPRVRELIVALRQAYKLFAATTGSDQPTDILITKIILGTFGCLPACDRYFIAGFKSEGFSFSRLNDNFVGRVLSFCHQHRHQLEKEQARIEERGGIHYPLMKLVDMYFWQLGYEQDTDANQ
jgi:hypothetical protein